MTKFDNSCSLRFSNSDGNDYPRWEYKRLDSISKIRMGFTPNTKDSTLWDGELPWVSIRGLHNKYVNLPSRKITDKATQGKRIIPTDSLIMSFKLTLGKLAITKTPLYTNEAICSFEWNDDSINTEYMYYALSQVDVASFGSRAVMGITLNTDSLNSILVPVPSLFEQVKIANFFTALDENIDAHESKLGLLKQQKQGYMQQVFSHKLRFHDDNGNNYGDWEETSLGEIATLKNGFNFTPNQYVESGKYAVITIGHVNADQKYIETSNVKVKDIPTGLAFHQKLKIGDILISMTGSGGVGKVAIVNNSNMLLNQRVGVLHFLDKSKIDENFIYTILSSPLFENKMNSLGQGGAQPNLSKPDIENFSFSLPSRSEQEKIASFFSILDENIDSIVRKIKLLKEQKQGYMQRMF